MPISTVWILNYIQQCYVKWFWTTSSLGAPGKKLDKQGNIRWMGSFLGFTFLKTLSFEVEKYVFTEMEEAKMKYVIWSEAAYIEINSF